MVKNPPEFVVDWITAICIQALLTIVLGAVWLLWHIAPRVLIGTVVYVSVGALVAGVLAVRRRRKGESV